MLSIDEVIAHAREVAKRNREQWKNCPADRRDIEHQTCEQCAEEHEQIAEWLEELKELKSGTVIKSGEYPYFNGFKDGKEVGYNKAIDDFVKRLIEELSHTTLVKDGYYIANIIKPLAEQLKAGVNK